MRAALFSSDTKYDSGCGWPAFNDVLDKGRVKLSPDTSGGIYYNEIFAIICVWIITRHIFFTGSLGYLYIDIITYIDSKFLLEKENSKPQLL